MVVVESGESNEEAMTKEEGDLDFWQAHRNNAAATFSPCERGQA